jgi:hypothetical protein
MSSRAVSSGPVLSFTVKTIGWLTLGVMLFGAALMMDFTLYLAASAGDATHALVQALPAFAEHVQGDVAAAPRKGA